MEIVSVIIPAYNVEKYIFRGIESVLNQTYSNIELIIVDDGSEDSTLKIIQSYVKKDPRVKCIHQKNSGVSSARNNGLKHSKGKYVIFLDSDDWLEENTIKYLIKSKEKNPQLLVCVDRYFAYFDSKKEIYKERQRNNNFELKVDLKNAQKDIINGNYNLQSACYKLFDMDTIKNNSIYFNEKYFHGEDGLFVYQYLRYTKGLYYSTIPLWNILERPGSATSSPYNEKWITAIYASEEMLKYSLNDNEVKDVLNLFIINRIEEIEHECLTVYPVPTEIKFIRNKLKEAFKRANILKINNIWLKYVAYGYLPIFILSMLVRGQVWLKEK